MAWFERPICHGAPERRECLLATWCGVEELAVPGADAMRPFLGVMPFAEFFVHRHLSVLPPSGHQTTEA